MPRLTHPAVSDLQHSRRIKRHEISPASGGGRRASLWIRGKNPSARQQAPSKGLKQPRRNKTNIRGSIGGLQYCIAAAIILKDLSDRAFTQENITNPNIKELMKKIQVRICPELDEAFRLDPNQWSHRLTITLKNGEVITKQIDYPIGDFKNPFDSAMADRKFLTLTEDVLGNSTSSRLLENIHNLDSLEDINILFS